VEKGMQGYAEKALQIDFEPSKGMQNRRKIIKRNYWTTI
jgi:hypothetical protein